MSFFPLLMPFKRQTITSRIYPKRPEKICRKEATQSRGCKLCFIFWKSKCSSHESLSTKPSKTPHSSFFAAPIFDRSFAFFSDLCTTASAPMPPKTRLIPSHWPPDRECPNQKTLRSIVNILRVTVTVTSSSEEKRDRVWKMKSWPTAPQAANPRTCFSASGWRERKERAPNNSVSVDGGMGKGSRLCKTPL